MVTATKKWRSILVLCVFAAGLLGHPAGARGETGVVFATVGADFASGALGTITGTGDTVSAPVVSGLGGDLSLFASELGLFVAEHSFGAGTLDTLSLYESGEWSSPKWNVQVGSNIQGIVYSGAKIYLASQLTDRITQHDAEASLPQSGSVSLSEENGEGFEEHAAKLAEYQGALYVLVQSYNSVFPPEHKPGMLVKVDPQTLEITGKVALGKNPVALDVWGGKLYAACFGGAIGSAGGAPRLYRVDPVSLEAEVLDDGTALGENYAYSTLGIDDAGTLFVVAYKNGLEWPEQENAIFAGDVRNVSVLGGERPLSFRQLAQRRSVASPSGLYARSAELGSLAQYATWINAGAVDKTAGLFWVSNRGSGAGDAALEAFSSTKKEKSFGESQLKSLPYSVVPYSAMAPTAAPSGGGGGGCALGTGPFAMLLLLPLLPLFFRRNRA